MKVRTPTLPAALFDRLRTAPTGARAGLAIVVCTVDADGLPHPAMLSGHEVVALDAGRLRLAVYGGSGTSGNFRARGVATLIITDARLAAYIKGRVREVRAAMACAPHNALFELTVSSVELDAPADEHEAGLCLTGGVTFTPRAADALAEAEAMHRELRAGDSR